MKKLLTALTCLCLILSYSCSEDNCADSNCGPNGNCDPDTGNCICDDGFSGANCEINVCDAVDCGANGTCNQLDGTCACDTGFEGTACESKIRSRFIGDYIGDILPCVPDILSSQIPDEVAETLTETPITIGPNDSDVVLVDIGASGSMVLGLAVVADVTADDFTVEEFTQDLEVELPIIGLVTIAVEGEGTGLFLDDNNFQLNLLLNFVTPIGEFNTECEIIFTKQ